MKQYQGHSIALGTMQNRLKIKTRMQILPQVYGYNSEDENSMRYEDIEHKDIFQGSLISNRI